ncbi:MAG: VCBS repeat-containing protein, partial [Nanoarchaeota archaeon]
MKKEVITILTLTLLLISCQQINTAANEQIKGPVAEQPKAVVKLIDFSNAMDLENARIYSVAVYDVNKDGFDDIAAGVFGSYSDLFMNNKDGTFTRTQLIDKKYNTQEITFIDINKDGNKDLVLGNNQQPIVLLKNNGDGTFSLLKELDKTLVNDIAVADFDKDGYEDFIIGTQFKENYIYFNDGKEGFDKVKLPGMISDSPVKSVKTADMNNDGRTDIVFGIDRRQTRVYLNEGERNFVLNTELIGEPNTYSIALFDSDKDGKIDILQGNNKKQNFLFLNKGNNYEKTPINGDSNTYIVLAADFNNDKIEEVVIGDYEINIKVYEKSESEYVLLKEINTPDRDFVRDLAAGDFNN